MGMEYVREAYGVPAKRGGRIRTTERFGCHPIGTEGRITSATTCGRLKICMDGERKRGIYHPTWGLEYLPERSGLITQKRLKEILHYNSDTGIFTWLSGFKRGRVAGSLQQGYVAIQADKKIYGAHRLAWLYVHGRFPKECIDHINRVRDDNRISNLREADKSMNAKNQGPGPNSLSGYTGVLWTEKRRSWSSSIRVDGKLHWLGYYKRLEDAVDARQRAERKHGFTIKPFSAEAQGVAYP